VSGQLHAPVAFPPEEGYPLDKRLGGPRPVCKRGGEKMSLPLPEIEPRSSSP